MCLPALALAGAAGGGTFLAGTSGLLGAMSTMQAATLALSAGSAVAGAAGAYQQAQFSKEMANYNAGIAEMNAQDAIRRGNEEAMKVGRQGRQLGGTQRAVMAARGIDVGEGTAADILDQTDFFSLSDQNTVRNNAAREAWNYRARGAVDQAQADSTSPFMMAGASLLGSAGSVADRWYRYAGK